jgi:hypothetical protein
VDAACLHRESRSPQGTSLSQGPRIAPTLDPSARTTTAAATDRYIAHLAGLLPSDPWKVALADQAYAFMEDVMQTM